MTESPIRRMYQAVLDGDVSSARAVLAETPEVLTSDAAGYSWLYLAASKDNLAMLELLVDAERDVNHEEVNGDNSLSNAARSGSVQVTKWLLARGAKILDGTLICAVDSGSLELVRLLLEHGADVSFTFGSPPENALSHALFFGYSPIA